MAPQLSKGRLLALNLISAQDLAPVSNSMRTYAVAWVHPDRKLTTRVDESGHANPTWNEKFVFRVDDDALESEASEVTIEIYALTWLRVVLTGIIRARLVDLIPPSARKLSRNVTATRFFTLQVARPSGRPRGTINIGVSLINVPLQSMPLQSEVSATTHGATEVTVKEKGKNLPVKERRHPNDKMIQLRRSHSERTDDRSYPYHPPGSVHNDSMVNGSQVGGLRQKGAGGSMVGIGSLVSSIGPSASVVAEAIAKGLYPRRANAYNDNCRSSIVPAESESVEGLKTKMERWRTELPPLYDRKSGKPNPRGGYTRRRIHGDGGARLFSCFGNAYGCQFSVSCGGGGSNRKKHK